jgi:hypothetical protein
MKAAIFLQLFALCALFPRGMKAVVEDRVAFVGEHRDAVST